VSLSLHDIIRLLVNAAWRRRYLICVPLLVMAPISLIGAKWAPQTYESKMIVLLQEMGKNNPFLKDYVVGLDVKDRFSALQALLRSEHVLLNVLREIHGPQIEKDQRQLAIMMQRLALQVSVQLVGADLIEFRLKGSSPDGLGKTLASVSKHFLERLLSPERSSLGTAEDFLKDQKEKRRKDLEQAELAFANFKAENSDKLPAVYATTVQALGAMRQKLEEKTRELNAADAALGDIRHQLSSTNPIVGRLEEAMIQATSELTALKSRYTDGHSEVQAAERRLGRLQEERRVYMEGVAKIDQMDIERLWNLAAGQSQTGEKPPALLVSQLLRLQEARAKHAALQNDVEQLKTSVAEIHRTMALHGPIEQELQRLEKEVVSARELYDIFLKRHDSAATSRALGVFAGPDRVKIIDAPQDPRAPITLPPIVYMIAGLLAGLGLGCGLAVVAEMLDQRLRTPSDFCAILNVPLFGRLPLVPQPAFGMAGAAG
jgi:uncharacterized protein involved in exopolysaccharide biosynthesis